eukprot:329024-Alexandrium_andersonii.AAC.1
MRSESGANALTSRSGRGVRIVFAGVCLIPRMRVLSRVNMPFLRSQWITASPLRTAATRP